MKKVSRDEKGAMSKVPVMMTDMATGREVPSRLYQRKLSNYCSIGIDARIGFGFDKNRTKNRMCNKIVYAWEGIKKFCRPTLKMKSVIDRMEQLVEINLHATVTEKKPGEASENSLLPGKKDSMESSPRKGGAEDGKNVSSRSMIGNNQSSANLNESIINGYKVLGETIFTTKKGNSFHRTEPSNLGNLLTINPINLIALNIPSYMGGVQNMWNKSGKTVPIDSGVTFEKKQDFGDGNIEFLSFTDRFRFGLFERLITGGGKRVAQGRLELSRGGTVPDHLPPHGEPG